jgi:hypothetical protein
MVKVRSAFPSLRKRNLCVFCVAGWGLFGLGLAGVMCVCLCMYLGTGQFVRCASRDGVQREATSSRPHSARCRTARERDGGTRIGEGMGGGRGSAAVHEERSV